MSAFFAAFWAEALKARRSKILLLTVGGFLLLPLIGGLLMVILKDPEQARSMGLISLKAQLVAGVADWPTYFGILTMGTAIGGAMVFAIMTAWVFGREFSDHTVKELLALPTPRGIVVGAKFALTALWSLGLSLLMLMVGFGIGAAIGMPGWSPELAWTSLGSAMAAALLSWMLMPVVALIASAGRGYLPPLGWAFLSMALGQIADVLGWGDWFPWTVPGLLSNLSGLDAGQVGLHSVLVVLLVFIAGLAATLAWWRSADQAR